MAGDSKLLAGGTSSTTGWETWETILLRFDFEAFDFLFVDCFRRGMVVKMRCFCGIQEWKNEARAASIPEKIKNKHTKIVNMRGCSLNYLLLQKTAVSVGVSS